MILICQTYNVVSPNGGFIVEFLPGVEYGPAFTQLAIDSFVPGFGKSFVAIALFFFAFTSAMASYYIAETNLGYLSKKMFNKEVGKLPLAILRLVLLSTVYFGCIRKAGVPRHELVFDPIKLGIKNADFWEKKHSEKKTKISS